MQCEYVQRDYEFEREQRDIHGLWGRKGKRKLYNYIILSKEKNIFIKSFKINMFQKQKDRGNFGYIISSPLDVVLLL